MLLLRARQYSAIVYITITSWHKLPTFKLTSLHNGNVLLGIIYGIFGDLILRILKQFFHHCSFHISMSIILRNVVICSSCKYSVWTWYPFGSYIRFLLAIHIADDCWMLTIWFFAILCIRSLECIHLDVIGLLFVLRLVMCGHRCKLQRWGKMVIPECWLLRHRILLVLLLGDGFYCCRCFFGIILC